MNLKTGRRVALVLAFLLTMPSAPASGFVQQSQSDDLPGNLELPVTKHPRLDSRLARLMNPAARIPNATASQPALSESIPRTLDGALLVLITMNAQQANQSERPTQLFEAAIEAEEALFAVQELQVRSALDRFGGSFVGRIGNLIEAEVPIRSLDEIASTSAVSWIRPMPQPKLSVTSEGVQVTRAAQLLNSGAKYQPSTTPVRVGVLDIGFRGYAPLLGTELPATVTTASFSSLGLDGGTVHGTAVAEIIHDMAPGAQLFLVNSRGLVGNGQAVSWLIAQDVDLISYSVGWDNCCSPGDGRGPVNDNVRRALAAGIQWVSSAGNDARNHWQGTFSDPDGDGWHNFNGADETNSIAVFPGDEIYIKLDWDDWFASDQDYDLYLFDDSLNNVVASSTNAQTGFQPPFEIIEGTVVAPFVAHIAIRRFSATRAVQLQTFQGNRVFEYVVAEGSLTVPADTDGAIAVGATFWADDRLEPFSSWGPTADGRSKPDIAAPDGVANVSLNPFFGTSAAAPHVAGAIALMKSRFGLFSFDQIVEILLARAIPKGDANQYGAGRLDIIGQ